MPASPEHKPIGIDSAFLLGFAALSRRDQCSFARVLAKIETHAREAREAEEIRAAQERDAEREAEKRAGGGSPSPGST